MKKSVRVVYDANIYLSAIIFGGNPKTCLELARHKEIDLYVSYPILLEVAKNLQNKFNWTTQEIEEVIKGINEFANLVFPKTNVRIIQTHPQDNKILETALEAKADYIVSGDKKHLLSLKEFRKIKIISAKEFLDSF